MTEPTAVDYFDQNLASIRKHHPELAEKLSAAVENSGRFSVVDGKRAYPVCKVSDADGEFHLSSLYDPVAEANRLVAEETAGKEFNVVLLMGLGLGYQLAAAVDTLPDGTRYVVIEPELEAFKLQLSAKSFDTVFENKNISWIVGKTVSESVAMMMSHLDLLKLKGWVSLISPPVHRLYRDFISQFFSQMDDRVTAQRLGTATDLIASEIFLRNSLTNLKHALGAPGVMHFYKAWDKKPAVIVSAGPSLERHLPLLKEYQDRILLICVGAAWKSLRAADIEPHLVVAVDPFKDNYPHFEGLEAKREWLVSDFACNTDVVRTFAGKKIFAQSTTTKEALFRAIYGEWGILLSGGSVANSAFSLAVTMGASPVILVGQDLAYTGGISHATGHTGKHSLKEALESQPDAFKEVPGYGDGPPVLTNNQMLTYKMWFEQAIKQHEPGYVINATEGGAKIAGAVERPFLDVLQEFGNDPVRMEELWPESHPNQSSPVKRITTNLHKIRDKIGAIKTASESAYNVMQQIMEKSKKDEDCRNLEIKYNGFAKKITKQNHAVDFFLTAFVQQEIFFTQRRINLVETADEKNEKYLTNLILHASLPKACQRAMEFLQETAAHIQGR
jgi:hypothetical protein